MKYTLIVVVIFLLSAVSTVDANVSPDFEEVITIDVEPEEGFRITWHPVYDWLTIVYPHLVQIVDIHTQEVVFAIEIPEPVPLFGVLEFAWSDDGEFLALGYWEMIEIWQFQDDSYNLNSRFVSDETVSIINPTVAWSDDRLITVTGQRGVDDSIPRKMVAWEYPFENKLYEFSLDETYEERRLFLDSVIVSPDNKTLAVYMLTTINGGSHSIFILDAETLEIINEISEGRYNVKDSELYLNFRLQYFWLDNHTIFGISCYVYIEDCSVWSWEIDTGIFVTLAYSNFERITRSILSHLSWNGTNRFLAAGSIAGGFINYIKIYNGETISVNLHEFESILSVQWNSTDELLAISSSDKVHIWRLIAD